MLEYNWKLNELPCSYLTCFILIENQIKINKKHVYYTKVLYCTKPMSIQDESGSIPEESINFLWRLNLWSCDLSIIDYYFFQLYDPKFLRVRRIAYEVFFFMKISL
jgi:hypothetical protein